MSDRAQARRGFERAGAGFADREQQAAAFVDQIDHGAQAIGAILELELALQPEAAIGAADARPRRVDPASAARREGGARNAAALAQLVHAQHGAAQRALAAAALALRR